MAQIRPNAIPNHLARKRGERGHAVLPTQTLGALRESLQADERQLLNKLLRWHEVDTLHDEEAKIARRLLRRLRPPPLG